VIARRDALLVALTFAAGSVDAVAFLALDALTAVMTGNLVLLGVAIGRGAARSALRNLIALAGYATGVVVAARVAGRGTEPLSSPRVLAALAIECALQAVFLVGWVASAGEPDGSVAAVLIAASGIAMGIQATTVAVLGSRISTTYVTGVITSLVRDLSHLSALGADTGRSIATVAALLAGAFSGALVLATFRLAAPAIPLVITATVIALASRAPREEPQGL
jgi:uncharacterized membrane protein YoaK (UPF0700 family)